MPQAVDYAERAATLEEAIRVFKDENATAAEKNKILKSIISRIEHHGVPHTELKYGENSFSIKVLLRL